MTLGRKRAVRWATVLPGALLIAASLSLPEIPRAAAPAAPAAASVSPPGTYAYVANTGSGTVSVINTVTRTVTATVVIGDGTDPVAVAVSPDGERVYVADETEIGEVSVIDTATNTVTATLAVVPEPDTLAMSPDGAQLYVGGENEGNDISVVNTATGSVTTVEVGGAEAEFDVVAMAVSPDSSHLYIATDVLPENMYELDTASDAQIALFAAGGDVTGLAFSPDGSRLYATVLTDDDDYLIPIDTSDNSVLPGVDVGIVDPVAVAVSPDGTLAYVADDNFSDDGDVSVVNTSSDSVVATVAGMDGATALAVTPDGTAVYVTDGLSPGTVYVIGTAGETLEQPSIAVQDNPSGIAVGTILAPLVITTTSLPSGKVGTAYTATLTATGGTTPYTWSITAGALPSGLHLATATGTITGTPAGAGSWTFTAQVTDSTRPPETAARQLSIIVPAAGLHPRITPDPPVTTPGTVISVEVTGFPPRSALTIGLSGNPETQRATAGANGAATAQLVIDNEALTGMQTLQAISATGATASIPYLIVQGSLAPPDFVAQN